MGSAAHLDAQRRAGVREPVQVRSKIEDSSKTGILCKVVAGDAISEQDDGVVRVAAGAHPNNAITADVMGRLGPVHRRGVVGRAGGSDFTVGGPDLPQTHAHERRQRQIAPRGDPGHNLVAVLGRNQCTAGRWNVVENAFGKCCLLGCRRIEDWNGRALRVGKECEARPGANTRVELSCGPSGAPAEHAKKGRPGSHHEDCGVKVALGPGNTHQSTANPASNASSSNSRSPKRSTGRRPSRAALGLQNHCAKDSSSTFR